MSDYAVVFGLILLIAIAGAAGSMMVNNALASGGEPDPHAIYNDGSAIEGVTIDELGDVCTEAFDDDYRPGALYMTSVPPTLQCRSDGATGLTAVPASVFADAPNWRFNASGYEP